MKYILNHKNQFRSPAMTFILPILQILAAVALEACFLVYV